MQPCSQVKLLKCCEDRERCVLVNCAAAAAAARQPPPCCGCCCLSIVACQVGDNGNVGCSSLCQEHFVVGDAGDRQCQKPLTNTAVASGRQRRQSEGEQVSRTAAFEQGALDGCEMVCVSLWLRVCQLSAGFARSHWSFLCSCSKSAESHTRLHLHWRVSWCIPPIYACLHPPGSLNGTGHGGMHYAATQHTRLPCIFRGINVSLHVRPRAELSPPAACQHHTCLHLTPAGASATGGVQYAAMQHTRLP